LWFLPWTLKLYEEGQRALYTHSSASQESLTEKKKKNLKNEEKERDKEKRRRKEKEKGEGEGGFTS
jgi:hypothetical protein